MSNNMVCSLLLLLCPSFLSCPSFVRPSLELLRANHSLLPPMGAVLSKGHLKMVFQARLLLHGISVVLLTIGVFAVSYLATFVYCPAYASW
jgi:hypothetical protein